MVALSSVVVTRTEDFLGALMSRLVVEGHIAWVAVDLAGFYEGLAAQLVPWRGAYRTTQLLGGDSTFVLSGGGHIQHLVNPPGNPKARYRLGPPPGPDPDAWTAGSAEHKGTWWGHWSGWVHTRSGKLKRSRKTLGSAKYPPLEPAPGSYVRQK